MEIDTSQNATFYNDVSIDSGFLSLGQYGSELVISSDAITAIRSRHLVGAQTGTADDLSTISGGTSGDILILQATDGDTITVKDGTDNIRLGQGDCPLGGSQWETLTLIYDNNGIWIELARSLD